MAAMLDHSRHRGESATKTVKFFVAHTVNCIICNNHTIIDWMLLNFTPVIQQNCHHPGRKFEKSFCAVDRLTCQLELSKSETSQFRSDLVFDIVNYMHVIFLHVVLRYLTSSDFCVAKILWASNVPESSRFWQHHSNQLPDYGPIVSHFATHAMWLVCFDILKFANWICTVSVIIYNNSSLSSGSRYCKPEVISWWKVNIRVFYTRFLSPTGQKCAESSAFWQFFYYCPPSRQEIVKT